MFAINVCYVLSLKMLCVNYTDNEVLFKSKSIKTLEGLIIKKFEVVELKCFANFRNYNNK